MAITGTAFGNIQLMSLTTPSSSVISLTLVTSSTTSITASLPGSTPPDSLAYGNYTLQVTLSGTGTSSSSYQTLRFAITLSPPPTTTLLFPLIITGTPFGTQIEIEAATEGASGACTLNWIRAAGPPNPPPSVIGSFGPTTQFSLAAGDDEYVGLSFYGHMKAVCPFSANGGAVVNTNLGDLTWVPAIVVNQ